MVKQGRQKNILSVKRLSLGFIQDSRVVQAVEDLLFTIDESETLVLIGESGCGKSLTSHAIMNLLPENAGFSRQSQIRFKQTDLLTLDEVSLRTVRGKRIAMIFQEPMTALNPVLTIGQQVGEVLRKHFCLNETQVKAKVLELLKDVEIPEPELRYRQYPHQLSGGQKQRIVIAMAIACEPELLIADEPTTALDVTIQQQILNLLKRLQAKHGMGLLLITHDLGVAKAVADTVCVMYCGQIVEQAAADVFFNRVKHPYSQQLLAALPSVDKREVKLHSIEGTVPALTDLPGGCRFHPRCLYVMDKCTRLVPELLNRGGTQVRCHLFEDKQELPPLNLKHEAQTRKKEQHSLLEVSQLSVHFTHKKRYWRQREEVFKAVDGVSFSLNRGETLAIVGESGCGKTTLSRAILRLLPIAHGEVLFEGCDLKLASHRALIQLRREMQIIFQDPFSSMNPRMLVFDVVAEGLIAHGRHARESVERRVVELLAQVGMDPDSRFRYPHQFSGGQRQRICIARALALKPKLIVCDEPTSALDVSVQAQILNLLKSLQQQHQLSYIFITHDMAVVSYMADRILVMESGKVVEQGNALDVLTQPQHVYTKRLLSSIYTV